MVWRTFMVSCTLRHICGVQFLINNTSFTASTHHKPTKSHLLYHSTRKIKTFQLTNCKNNQNKIDKYLQTEKKNFPN